MVRRAARALLASGAGFGGNRSMPRPGRARGSFAATTGGDACSWGRARPPEVAGGPDSIRLVERESRAEQRMQVDVHGTAIFIRERCTARPACIFDRSRHDAWCVARRCFRGLVRAAPRHPEATRGRHPATAPHASRTPRRISNLDTNTRRHPATTRRIWTPPPFPDDKKLTC